MWITGTENCLRRIRLDPIPKPAFARLAGRSGQFTLVHHLVQALPDRLKRLANPIPYLFEKNLTQRETGALLVRN
jgi:hypothetical protein